jgi:DnaK suppressor protein
MDDERARTLLKAERTRVEGLIDASADASRQDRAAANEQGGDRDDSAPGLNIQEADDAIVAGLRERLAALDRAERRLQEGTFGRSVRSGTPIPDARLEADPAAELTVEEAR